MATWNEPREPRAHLQTRDHLIAPRDLWQPAAGFLLAIALVAASNGLYWVFAQLVGLFTR